MKSSNKTILIGAGAAGLGYLLYKSWNVKKSVDFFQYSISSLKVSFRNILQPELIFGIQVYNPNKTGVPISEFFGTINYGSVLLANFRSTGPIVLAGSESKVIDVATRVSVMNVLAQIFAGTSQPNVVVNGMLKTPFFDLPIKKTVSMSSISGVNTTHASVGFLAYEPIAGKAQRKAKRAARREKRKGKPKLFKKIALAVPRNAFLALVALNVNKMAEKLYQKIKTDEPALRNKWTKLGGQYDKLKNTVLKKVTKKGLAGFEDDGDDPELVGIAVTTALASALPIIKALAEFLGKQKDASVEVTDDGIVEQTEVEEDEVEGMYM